MNCVCVCVGGGGGGGGQSVLTQYNNISKAVITITSGIYQVTEAVSLSIILLQSRSLVVLVCTIAQEQRASNWRGYMFAINEI